MSQGTVEQLCGGSQSSSNEVSATDFGALDSTLSYIIKCLEGDHVKSGSITQHVRQKVLLLVKARIAWKRHPRTKQEVDDYVSTVNRLMGDIVSRILCINGDRAY